MTSNQLTRERLEKIKSWRETWSWKQRNAAS